MEPARDRDRAHRLDRRDRVSHPEPAILPTLGCRERPERAATIVRSTGALPRPHPYIIIYRAADSKSGGGRGLPHGVVDVVFGVWLPTFERPGGGREGVRSQDRRYRSGRRRTRADSELRGLRIGYVVLGRCKDNVC